MSGSDRTTAPHEGNGRPPGQTAEAALEELTGEPARPGAAGDTEPAGGEQRGYARGARILTIGIASTGLMTFLYFALASHALSEVAYADVVLAWSMLFIIVSVIYRPVEQLLSRTIADRRARGLTGGHPIRTPALIQGGFALTFLVVALALRPQIQDEIFGGSALFYWVLVIAAVAYAASYFARGWLAGHERYVHYGVLVFMEAFTRVLFALVVVVGLADGQTLVAIGIAAAPFLSLLVVPWALERGLRRRPREVERLAPTADAALEGPAAEGAEEASGDMSLKHGTGFALGVLAIMLAEQALLNAAVIAVDVTSSDEELAGFVFNVFLVTRAPLQVFQAIQTSLLPHLAGLEAKASRAAFDKAVRVTVLAIAGFSGAVALGLLAVGPFVMSTVFGGDYDYERGGLVLMAIAMGLHLTAATLNQAALARGHEQLAGLAWLVVAGGFIAFVISPVVSDVLLRVQVGYFGAMLILCALLLALYRRPGAAGDEEEPEAVFGKG